MADLAVPKIYYENCGRFLQGTANLVNRDEAQVTGYSVFEL